MTSGKFWGDWEWFIINYYLEVFMEQSMPRIMILLEFVKILLQIVTICFWSWRLFLMWFDLTEICYQKLNIGWINRASFLYGLHNWNWYLFFSFFVVMNKCGTFDCSMKKKWELDFIFWYLRHSVIRTVIKIKEFSIVYLALNIIKSKRKGAIQNIKWFYANYEETITEFEIHASSKK